MRLRPPERPVELRRDLTDFRHPDTRPENLLAHRTLTNALATAAPKYVCGRLLDVGCGLKPYAPLLASYVTEHIGVDHPDSPHAATSVDVVASAYSIPLDDASFDTVLLSEVLEHLERPADALSECFRLLRPGGRLLLSAPFVWMVHEEPRDFYRYSPFGLRFLLEQAGFDVIALRPLGGQWLTLALMLSYALGDSPANRFPRLLARAVVTMQRAAAWADSWQFRPWLSHSHFVIAGRPLTRILNS
jgi:SAM-dependent methyltransferase